jgi:hypothetical protein
VVRGYECPEMTGSVSVTEKRAQRSMAYNDRTSRSGIEKRANTENEWKKVYCERK